MGDRQGLIHAYDEEHGLGLTDLDSEEERLGTGNGNGNGKLYEHANGNGSKRSFVGSDRDRSHSRRGSPLPR